MLLQLLFDGIMPSYSLSDKFENLVTKYAFMTCSLHAHHMFGEMSVMVRAG